MRGRLLVLILFSASGSPLFFFFSDFSHPASPSTVRFHGDSKWATDSRYPLPHLHPAGSLVLSLEIPHPRWPLAEPQPEAKVLGVWAGSRAHPFRDIGERLRGRARGGWRRMGLLSPGPLGQGQGLALGCDICTVFQRGFWLVWEGNGFLKDVLLVGGKDHRLGSFSQNSRHPVGDLEHHAVRLLVFSWSLLRLTQRTVSLLAWP